MLQLLYVSIESNAETCHGQAGRGISAYKNQIVSQNEPTTLYTIFLLVNYVRLGYAESLQAQKQLL
jgi:hypothetical protein